MSTCSSWVNPHPFSSRTPNERETCRFFLSIAASFRNYMAPREQSHFFIFLLYQLYVVFVFFSFGIYVNSDRINDCCPEEALAT